MKLVFKGQSSLVCGGISIPKNYIFVLNVIIIFFNLPAAHARSNVATQWVHRYSKIALELFVKAKVQEFFPTISYSLQLKKHTPTPCRPQIFLSLARPPLPIFGRQECHITGVHCRGLFCKIQASPLSWRSYLSWRPWLGFNTVKRKWRNPCKPNILSHRRTHVRRCYGRNFFFSFFFVTEEIRSIWY